MRHSLIDRAMVLWCPDWPVTAMLQHRGLAADAEVALIDNGLVLACSASARREGVRRGLRAREAQSRCPGLLVFPYDVALDNRAFDPVLAAIEEIMPGVQLLRPGCCVLRVRGPARYYGGEEEAALWLLDRLDTQVHGARVGIADGVFTAERAARQRRRQRVQIVPEGESAEFLSALPIDHLDDPRLVSLVRRLGIRTLGDFAALSASSVRDRFGADGARLHALACGRDSRPIVPRHPPERLHGSIDFWPPLDRVDQIAFGFRAPADRFVQGLVESQLVCTALRIEVESESGEISERQWLHPRSFTAADVVDRLRWQLQGGAAGSGLRSGIVRVQVTPEGVDAIGHHEEGLWGSGRDERIHHGLSRVQSMLGHGGVAVPAVSGGRVPTDRQRTAAWGDPVTESRPSGRPWPGSLPAPYPATIFPFPRMVTVLTTRGEQLEVTARGTLSGDPARFSPTGSTRDLRALSGWAGPWPLEERWWDSTRDHAGHVINRFQVVDADGMAWLLALQDGRWWAEARYD